MTAGPIRWALSSGAQATVHRAGWVMADPGHIYRNGFVQVAAGRIRAVGGGPPPPRAEETIDHGPGVLAPALVNAHTHLELGALKDRLPCQKGFKPWVAELIRQRAALSEQQIRDGIRRGLAELTAAGCAVIGEISTLGHSRDLLVESPLSGIHFLELLGNGPTELPRHQGTRGGIQEALAAHAPHTTSPRLLKAVKAATREAGLPMSIHLAESHDEMEFITTAGGPWAAFLSERGIDFSDWGLPAASAVAHLDRLGLLDERTLVVHLLHAERQAFERLAERGVPVCICPRSNRTLHGRLPKLTAMLAAHLTVCLGTDSLASVASLNLWEEMQLVATGCPEISPAQILEMATLNGARALGLAPFFGALTPGRLPAMVYLPLAASSPEALLEIMVHGKDWQSDRLI